MIEMILDHRLASSSNEDELFYPGVARFLDGVLDKWFVNNREHFFFGIDFVAAGNVCHAPTGKIAFRTGTGMSEP